MTDKDAINRIVKAVTDKFIAEGKLIEAGFAAFSIVAIPKAPPEMVRAMRVAFFSGAQHLFGTIMNALDLGDDPTEDDMTKMEQIDKELRAFVAGLKKP